MIEVEAGVGGEEVLVEVVVAALRRGTGTESRRTRREVNRNNRKWWTFYNIVGGGYRFVG